MRWGTALSVLSVLFSSVYAWSASFNDAANLKRHDLSTGFNTLEPRITADAQFDNYTFFLRGERIFLYSVEFHTYRLPVPSLWLDILQKVKAAGLNAVSVYLHMGAINPSRGVVDFDGYRAVKPLYEAAMQAGIWIVLRPGPYINAETTAGGISHWITSEIAGTLRTDAPDWQESWQAYIEGVIEETRPFQIQNGGPVIAVQIDNEYAQNETTGRYFQALEDKFRAGGIDVPLTYNDPGEGKNFVNGTGAVDLYGLDSYPQSFDCSNPSFWKPVVDNYHDYHEQTNPSQVWYFPEFQGGAFDPWGPNAPGYEGCRILTGPDFQNVFYQHLWASNAKMISYYMGYGGTSWGAIPFPGVYTSYDYGAALREDRQLTTKFDELKRQGLFLRSSPDFYKTDWIGNSSSLPLVDNKRVFVTRLTNPDTRSNFYVARQLNSTAIDSNSFHLNISTSSGDITVPQVAPNITLDGRQSKLIVTDYPFGAKSSVLYSTAAVFFAGVIDGRDVLFVYGDKSQAHEVAVELTGSSLGGGGNGSTAEGVKVTQGKGGNSNSTILSFDGAEGLNTVWDSDTQLVLFADTDTAAMFFAPAIPSSSGSADFANFWSIGSNESVLVGGPYLVRNASISGSELVIRGDLNESVTLSVVAPSSVSSVMFNGKAVPKDEQASAALTKKGGFVGKLSATVPDVKAPEIGEWKFKDSLPEIVDGFDDATWVVAANKTTNSPFKPYYGDRVLYGCDYGFCENIVLWRGHFNGSAETTSMNLSINGGEAFAASVWLNDVFLNTSFGNSSDNKNILEETDDLFTFPEGAVKVGEENVVTIVQDNMGLNETNDLNPDTSKSPRGVRGFKLTSGNFTEWKVQGKIGGYRDFPDKFRGVMNEGGLFGERAGWHLPGFDTSSWTSRNISQGLPDGKAGVGFFVSTFKLDVEQGLDVMMSVDFTEEFGEPYRAIVFVNGWMMGKRVGNLGPQAVFPVHQGILDYSGTNTLAVALWSMESNVTVAPQLKISVNEVLEGGVGGIVNQITKWSADGRPLSK